MGFILPVALVFVANPLETFIHSLRTVLGLIGIGMMRAVSLLLRVFGNGMRHIGTLAERLYDLPLFVPLWIETPRTRIGRLSPTSHAHRRGRNRRPSLEPNYPLPPFRCSRVRSHAGRLRPGERASQYGFVPVD
jgi:hypothetical protein